MSNDVTVTMPREYWEQVVKCIDIALAPKPDIVVYRNFCIDSDLNVNVENHGIANSWKLVFDGETNQLKSAEKIV